jgi:hypothetical protein
VLHFTRWCAGPELHKDLTWPISMGCRKLRSMFGKKTSLRGTDCGCMLKTMGCNTSWRRHKGSKSTGTSRAPWHSRRSMNRSLRSSGNGEFDCGLLLQQRPSSCLDPSHMPDLAPHPLIPFNSRRSMEPFRLIECGC